MKTVDELVAFSNARETGLGHFSPGVCTYVEDELRALAKSLVKLPVGSCVVEIGTWAGRSASLYFQLQKDLNLDIHLIDNWSVDTVFAVNTFDKMILDYFNDLPYTFHHMSSDRLGHSWNSPINFLHIDGCHDPVPVTKDCTQFLPHVVPGGIVAFHDADGSCWGVTQCIDKFVRPSWELLENTYRVMTWRKPL